MRSLHCDDESNQGPWPVARGPWPVALDLAHGDAGLPDTNRMRTMTQNTRNALSDVLDRLESSIQGETVSVQQIAETLGRKSFASLLLIFPLISASPVSAIPGVTATVAASVFMLVGQMIIGRECVWLPAFLRCRHRPRAALRKGTGWLRKPVEFVERFLKARLTFIVERPWLYLPLGLILAMTVFMPFMELVPTSGSIASGIIAVFAAGLLTRDGGLVLVSLFMMLGLPVLVWQVGTSI